MKPKLEKPRYGEACNGCGLCCIASQCPVSTAVFGFIRGVCPALVEAGDKLICGMMTTPDRWAKGAEPEEMAEAVQVLLGAETYCDAVRTPMDDLRRSIMGASLVKALKASRPPEKVKRALEIAERMEAL